MRGGAAAGRALGALALGALALGVLLCPGPARSADARLWLQPGADPERARQAAAVLGHAAPELEPLGGLIDAVQVISVVDRRIEDLCGGPVQVPDWRTRLEAARGLLQVLELDRALAAFGLLEAELPCLTGRLTPTDLVRFHLSTAELHLVAAGGQGPGSALSSFHRTEAGHAVRRAAATDPLAEIPPDTLGEARELLGRARAELSELEPARVVIVGDPAQVWHDGSPGMGAPVELAPGSHLFQLTDPGGTLVLAVQPADLGPGAAAVVWARPDAAPLTSDALQLAVNTLVSEGRAPIGLAPMLRALSAEGPSYLVTGDAQAVQLWGADGDAVRLRYADPTGQDGEKRRRRRAARGR